MGNKHSSNNKPQPLSKIGNISTQEQIDSGEEEPNSSQNDIKQHFHIEKNLYIEKNLKIQQASLAANQKIKFCIKSVEKSKKCSPNESYFEEVNNLSVLDHPNIIRLHTCLEDQNSIHIVTELCSGGSLAQLINHSQDYFTEDKAKTIIRQILYALNYMHSQGIAHRDINPQNILFQTDGAPKTLKIVSFKASKALAHIQNQKLQSIIGTALYYDAPEVLKGEFSEKSDCWSVGVILYQLLAGTVPFYGTDCEGLFFTISRGYVNFEGRRWRYISTNAKDLIKKLLEIDSTKRISPSQALNHDWFKDMPIVRPTIQILERIRQNSALLLAKCFKKEAIRVISDFLPEQDLREARVAFEYIDKSKRGFLKLGEIEKVFEEFEPEKTNSFVNWTGVSEKVIAYRDFLICALDMRLLLKNEYLFEAFKFFVGVKSDGITQNSLIRAMCQLRREISKSEVEDIFSKASDHSKIKYEDFKSLFGKRSAESPGQQVL